jgi:hypothetical protein
MNDCKEITVAEAKARCYDPVSVERAALNEAARHEAAALILEIEAAFAGVPRPVVTLSVARGYDDEWSLSEDRVQELNSKDTETTWQEVSDEAIQCCQEYFTFSDPEGWRFYLPAFMCHYLRHFPGCGWDAVYWACVRRDHVELLSRPQLRCLDRFTELCHKYESPA